MSPAFRDRVRTLDAEVTSDPSTWIPEAQFMALMPRPTGTELPRGHIAVRLDAPTIARLDALLRLYVLRGRDVARSDVLRAVLLAGLGIEEERLRLLDEGGSGLAAARSQR